MSALNFPGGIYLVDFEFHPARGHEGNPPVPACLVVREWPSGRTTRYRQADEPCTVVGAAAGQLELTFDAPQWAATPGQSAVLYDGEVCLGGGVIHSAPTMPMA